MFHCLHTHTYLIGEAVSRYPVMAEQYTWYLTGPESIFQQIKGTSLSV
jgi:hypothetical protein